MRATVVLCRPGGLERGSGLDRRHLGAGLAGGLARAAGSGSAAAAPGIVGTGLVTQQSTRRGRAAWLTGAHPSPFLCCPSPAAPFRPNILVHAHWVASDQAHACLPKSRLKNARAKGLVHVAQSVGTEGPESKASRMRRAVTPVSVYGGLGRHVLASPCLPRAHVPPRVGAVCVPRAHRWRANTDRGHVFAPARARPDLRPLCLVSQAVREPAPAAALARRRAASGQLRLRCANVRYGTRGAVHLRQAVHLNSKLRALCV